MSLQNWINLYATGAISTAIIFATCALVHQGRRGKVEAWDALWVLGLAALSGVFWPIFSGLLVLAIVSWPVTKP